MPISHEPDAELSELVETFEKLRPVQSLPVAPSAPTPAPAPQSPPRPGPPVVPVDKMVEYTAVEMNNLKKKQAALQEAIETKTKEVANLRETLLVVNGAVQGIQHVQTFISDRTSWS